MQILSRMLTPQEDHNHGLSTMITSFWHKTGKGGLDLPGFTRSIFTCDHQYASGSQDGCIVGLICSHLRGLHDQGHRYLPQSRLIDIQILPCRQKFIESLVSIRNKADLLDGLNRQGQCRHGVLVV